MCVYQEKGEPVKVVGANQWEHTVKIESEWKEETARGSALPEANKNPNVILTTEKSGNVFLMIHQKSKDVSAIIFDEKRIMPAKNYVGMHVIGDDGSIVAKSERWHNSKEVYLYVTLEKKKKYIILPSTRNPGEEGEFILSCHSHHKCTLNFK